jgi:hypothetical protein
MTTDITPEAVERLAANLDSFVNYSSPRFVSCDDAKTLRALSAALTASQAETAAAYEVAAMALDDVAANWSCGHDVRDCDCFRDIEQWGFAADEVRALTPADSKAALDRMIAEARADALSGLWEDKPDALTAAVDATHPVYTKDYKTYTEALELVSSRHSKGSLVGLVNYLLVQNKAIPKGTPHE